MAFSRSPFISTATAGAARDRTAKQSLDVLRDAIELHKAQNGTYPGGLGNQDWKHYLPVHKFSGLAEMVHTSGRHGHAFYVENPRTC